MLTDVQTPFLGTPSVPVKLLARQPGGDPVPPAAGLPGDGHWWHQNLTPSIIVIKVILLLIIMIVIVRVLILVIVIMLSTLTRL